MTNIFISFADEDFIWRLIEIVDCAPLNILSSILEKKVRRNRVRKIKRPQVSHEKAHYVYQFLIFVTSVVIAFGKYYLL